MNNQSVKLVPIPHISKIKHKGFHPLNEKKLIKSTNKCIRDCYDEFLKNVVKTIEKYSTQFSKYSQIEFYDATGKSSSDFDAQEYYYKLIYSNSITVFNSIIKNMKSEIEKVATTSNETLEDKKIKIDKIIAQQSSYIINFCEYIKYVYKNLCATYSNISNQFKALNTKVIALINSIIYDEFGIHKLYFFTYMDELAQKIIPSHIQEDIPPYCIDCSKKFGQIITSYFSEYLKKPNEFKNKYRDLKKEFKDIESEIEEKLYTTVKTTINEYVEHHLKADMFKKQERKRKQLRSAIGKALDIIHHLIPEKKSQQITDLEFALLELKKILEMKSGVLTEEQIEFIDKSFGPYRMWYKKEISESETSYLDIITNSKTARIIINLYALITDTNGNKDIPFYVKSYIDKYVSVTPKVYNCDNLHDQIEDGLKLLKNKNNTNEFKYNLNSIEKFLEIFEKILEGKNKFLTTESIDILYSIFKLKFTPYTPTNNNETTNCKFIVSIKGTQYEIDDKDMQCLTKEFLELTKNDKEFIVKKLKNYLKN